MLWDQSIANRRVQNEREVQHINGLGCHGAAILDGRTLSYGSHHQKILIVKGEEGLIAFCGGVTSTRIESGQPAIPKALRSTTCTAASRARPPMIC